MPMEVRSQYRIHRMEYTLMYYVVKFCIHVQILSLQATKLFIVTLATRGRGVVTTPLDLVFWFKILYRVIKSLIQHCLLSKMAYLNVKYVIATRNYDFFNTGISG